MNAFDQLLTQHLDQWAPAIKRKSAVGRGSSNKIELYGIKKLRELILELAVRGLLVPQDPNEEPASDLLKKVAAKKARLVKEGKIKKEKSLPAIDEDNVPFQSPSGWAWSCLAALGEIAPRNVAGDDVAASFVPMPLVSTDYDGSHSCEERKWSEIKKGYTHFADGDVAIAKITPCFENSKAAIFSGLHNGIGAGTTELHVLRPFGEYVNRKYVLLYLKSPQFLTVGESRMTGSAGQKRVPTEFFANNPIPLPPLAEQHRIAAKVDELMALCDQLEQQTETSLSAHQTLVETLLKALTSAEDHAQFASAWQRIAAHFDTLFTTEQSIDQLKQTLLQLAIMGKLVPQDSNDEPASELLKKIAAEKARLVMDGKIKKERPLSLIADEEKPFELPTGWVWARFPELGEFGRGKSKHRPRNDPKLFNPGVYPLVQTGEVARANNIITEYHSKYSELGLSQSKLWPTGTLCITIAANIADSALLGFDACFPDSVVGFIPCKPLRDARYFLAFMKTARAELLKFAPATAQKNINLEILESVLIPIPPQSEIERISTKIDELMELCDQLKARLSDAQTTQLHLADAMAEKVLTGA